MNTALPVRLKKNSGRILFALLLFLLAGSQAWSQTYTIPDVNFSNCLKETYPQIFDSNGDLIIEEAKKIEYIPCTSKGIESIEGIQYFEILRHLNIGSNKIKELPDISNLTKLHFLYAGQNLITTCPDFSHNPELEGLDFSNNPVTVFPDISNNLNIRQLSFSSTQIQSIPDLSAFTELYSLNVSFTTIKSLPDLSKNTNLSYLSIMYSQLETFPDVSHNINLKHLFFDHNPQFTTLPDLSHNVKLYQLTFGGNPQFEAFPDLSHNTELVDLRFPGNGLYSIPDLSALTELNYLDCSGNQLETLPDLSKNTKLERLDCYVNYLTQLPDLSKCTALKTLLCHSNLISSLPDLSGNTLLATLQCTDNKLTFEDLIPVVSSVSQTYYTPQDYVILKGPKKLSAGATFTLDLDIDNAVTTNVYTWYKNGNPIATTNSNTFTIDHVQATDAGWYKVTITNPNAPKLTLTSSAIDLVVDASPWEPVPGGSSNHIVIVPADVISNIAGEPLQTGDYIGLFFNNGPNIFVMSGAAAWTGENLAITIWGNSGDTFKNGFDTGEEIVVQIWKGNKQVVYTATATYDTHDPYTDQGKFRANGFSKILSLNTGPSCQKIDLYKGWNLISSYIKPAALSMASVFSGTQPVVAKDASGKILYAPEFGITNGTWNVAEGYMVYSSVKQSVNICGSRIKPDTLISLTKQSYPLFLPYYGNVQAPAGDVLAMLGTKYTYAQIMSYSYEGVQAQAYNYIPAHIIDPPIDQIGNMQPGLAFKVLLRENVPAFSYPAHIGNSNGKIKDNSPLLTAPARHFTAISAANTNNAVLIIPDNIFNTPLTVGDEIGVFSATGSLIGAITYNGKSMAVTLWEPTDSDDAFSVKLWQKNSDKEYAVTMTYASGTAEKFVSNTLMIATDAQVWDNSELGERDAVMLFPNPAVKDLQFVIRIEQEDTVQVMLYDVMGKARGVLFNGTLPRGTHQKTLDVSAFPAGHYIYRVRYNNRITSDKLVIVK